MRIDIVSIFPQVFEPIFSVGMLRLAQERDLLEIAAHDLRDFTTDKHRQVDDVPYGGGPGMVMKPEPFYNAVVSLLDGTPFVLPRGYRTVLLTPEGRPLHQGLLESLAKAERMILLCGRYEGVDARVGGLVTDEISIGDYILSGGEIGAMVLVDGVGRLIGGVLGAEASLAEESFTAGLLEYPQYTRPASWRGNKVPDILLSGNHGEIKIWRDGQAAFKTAVRRPDMMTAESLGEKSAGR